MKIKITLIIIFTLVGVISSDNFVRFPLCLGENVKNYVESIVEFDSGVVVYMPFYGEEASQLDLDIIYKVTWKLIFETDSQLIIHLMDKTAGCVLDEQFKFLSFPDLYNKTEGVDYVILPHTCMNEAEKIEFYSGIKTVIPYDKRNYNMHFIPMLENITSFHDVDWYIGRDIQMAYNILAKKYNVKLLCTGLFFDVMPYAGSYYDPISGPLYGYIAGWEQSKEIQGATGYFILTRSFNDFILSFPICFMISTGTILLLNQIYPLEELSKRFDSYNVKHYDVIKPELEKR